MTVMVMCWIAGLGKRATLSRTPIALPISLTLLLAMQLILMKFKCSSI